MNRSEVVNRRLNISRVSLYSTNTERNEMEDFHALYKKLCLSRIGSIPGGIATLVSDDIFPTQSVCFIIQGIK